MLIIITYQATLQFKIYICYIQVRTHTQPNMGNDENAWAVLQNWLYKSLSFFVSLSLSDDNTLFHLKIFHKIIENS